MGFLTRLFHQLLSALSSKALLRAPKIVIIINARNILKHCRKHGASTDCSDDWDGYIHPFDIPSSSRRIHAKVAIVLVIDTASCQLPLQLGFRNRLMMDGICDSVLKVFHAGSV